jgi:hypothetical protein
MNERGQACHAARLAMALALLITGSSVAQTPENDPVMCDKCVCGRTHTEVKGNAQESDVAGCLSAHNLSLEQIRVKMHGVGFASTFGAAVSKSGHFSFRNLPNGDYVLVVVGNGEIIGLRAVAVPSSFPVILEVSKREPNPRIEY